MAFQTSTSSGGDTEGRPRCTSLAKRLKDLRLQDVTPRDRLRRTIFRRTRSKKMYQKHMVSMYCTWSG
eukprot:CAMPEP_0170188642 /NCGR_PEP_ID=MMETSP0040_2-20121228/44852_1 /TAXON_ID=641309 /ORGANISM="Lotharella oceanica, Strain CCMP622" /LENGTH=67 /DNA_ID=CAMNT_0010435983 /DNA_START=24 /DNA_END=223 /DNA_ORIENTATION=-